MPAARNEFVYTNDVSYTRKILGRHGECVNWPSSSHAALGSRRQERLTPCGGAGYHFAYTICSSYIRVKERTWLTAGSAPSDSAPQREVRGLSFPEDDRANGARAALASPGARRVSWHAMLEPRLAPDRRSASSSVRHGSTTRFITASRTSARHRRERPTSHRHRLCRGLRIRMAKEPDRKPCGPSAKSR